MNHETSWTDSLEAFRKKDQAQRDLIQLFLKYLDEASRTAEWLPSLQPQEYDTEWSCYKAKELEIFMRIMNIRQPVTVISLENATARCQALFLYIFSNTNIPNLFFTPNDINILKIQALYMLNIYSIYI